MLPGGCAAAASEFGLRKRSSRLGASVRGSREHVEIPDQAQRAGVRGGHAVAVVAEDAKTTENQPTARFTIEWLSAVTMQ